MSNQHTARKLWCLDHVLRDKRATHFDFRFAYYIGSVTDRATGKAVFKQATAAEALGVTRRAIQLAAERLNSLGHIEIGFTPGKGHLNTYRLLLEKANVASPLEEEKANCGAPFDYGKANEASPFRRGKGERRDTKRRTASTQKANGHSHSIPCLIPCLIPTRAREPAVAEALGSLGASLSARIGADKAHSWFGKTAVVDVRGDTLVMEAPTKFIAARISNDYLSDVIACSAQLVPSIRLVQVVVASSEAAA